MFLGEGSIWTGREYMLVDIYGPSKFCAGPAVYTLNPYAAAGAPEFRVYPMPSYAGTVVPVAGGAEALVALKDGIWSLDLHSGKLAHLVNPESGVPTNRFNDGKASPDGRLWVGTMGEPGKVLDGVGGLYVLDCDRKTTRKALSGITISNGLAWHGSTMYYIDTPTGAVQAFDYDAAAGAISNPRVAFTIPAGTGHPDGCCIDADGNVWVAQWGGSRVVAYRPADGAILAEVRLPTAHVSSVTFGGVDLGDLLITTAKEHMSAEELAAQPHAGDVFIVRNCGWKGVPACAFRG